MSNALAIHDAQGRVVQFHCGPYTNPAMFVPPGMFYVETDVGGIPDPQQWRVVDGELVALPISPSPAHMFDYLAGAWIDPRTLDEFKSQKWEEIKALRSLSEYGGFTWDGSVFDSDVVSAGRISGACSLAIIASMNSAPFSQDWTLADNTTRTLNATDMIQVGVALGQHVGTAHNIAGILRAEIALATTIEEIQAIVWA